MKRLAIMLIAIIDGHVGRRAEGKSVVAVFAREMVKPVPKKRARQ